MSQARALVGETWEGTFTLDRWLSVLWAEATRNDMELFRDGSHGPLAPPTLAVVVGREGAGTGDIEGRLRDGKWDDPSVFLGSHRFTYNQPLEWGQTYHVTAEVTDLEQKNGSSGSFSLLTVSYDATTAKGETVFEMATDLVVHEEGGSEEGSSDSSSGRSSASEPGRSVADTVSDKDAVVRFEEVSAAEMQLMTALVRDPTPMHYDAESALRQGFPGRVNQGPINASYVAQAAFAVAESPADLLSLDARYEGFVFEGDDVIATGSVEEHTEYNDDTVQLTLKLLNQRGDLVLSGSAAIRMST
ncbi:FAS1-like dehydratase domain-containing protein [Halovenus marina]|uniref:MaoC family dehydratase n=1 Tax=Halovenus marina TaxID=3396621 RepID=UPI003F55A136